LARFANGWLAIFRAAEPSVGQNRPVKRPRGAPGHGRGMTVVVTSMTAALLVGCGSDVEPTEDVPEGFDVPRGVHITHGGTKRRVGQNATVVYHIEQRAASAVTVGVTQIETGSLSDFEFFNLPESVRSSTPLYVHVKVRNEGPSGLGGVALPIFARTSKRVFPPNELGGSSPPCPNAALPASFLPGASTNICLVFLMPSGENLESIDLQTAAQSDAIHFLPESP